MSELNPNDLTTPVKTAKPAGGDSHETSPATTDTTAAAISSNAPSPQKQLNVNAKAFMPKLDDKSILQSNNSSAQFNPASTKRPPLAAQTPVRTPSRMGSGGPTLPPPPPLLNPAAVFPPSPMFALNPAMLAAATGGLLPPAPLLYPTPLGPLASPMLFSNPPPPSPMNVVNVGNASLAALRSKEPPKFSCVLLVGLPASGKTTVGRDLVQGLVADKMPWAFFSGSDHIGKEIGSTRPAAWDTTKEVFQALSNRLDALIAKQGDPEARIKGLVIDKNCRGVEDLFYLTALLRAKQLPLVGVVGLEAKDDDVLLARMGGQEELREKLKHHRVIQARIAEAARAAGMYRGIDSTKPKDGVVQAMRTMVLGCSAQPPTRTIVSQTYSDGTCPLVDNYEEYCRVMSTLFTLLKPGVKGPQFPGFTDYTPFTTREMEDRKKIPYLKDEYVVRRRVDGVKHVLLFDGKKWYLIPRHMRAVFSVRSESWIGTRVKEGRCMVLDGDLVRLTKDRTKEKLVVSDVFFFSTDDDPSVNSIMRASWADRQMLLKTQLCDEASAFFPAKIDLIIVHQQVEEWPQALKLLDPLDYPSDGLVLQPRRSTDPTYVWRPPQSVTVDLRLGPQVVLPGGAPAGEPATPLSNEKAPETPLSNASVTAATPTAVPARTFLVEVYSRDDKKYVLFQKDTVEVRRSEAVEGSICICGLLFDDKGSCSWTFHRVRTDVARAAYKNQVEDLLENGLISRSRLVTWLQDERFARVETPGTAAPTASNNQALSNNNGVAASGGASAFAAPPPPPPAAAKGAPSSTATGGSGTSALSRGVFGVALPSAASTTPAKATVAAPKPGSSAAAISAVNTATVSLLQQMIPSAKLQQSNQTTVTAAPNAAPKNAKSTNNNNNNKRGPNNKSPPPEDDSVSASTATPTTAEAPQAAAATEATKRCAECKKQKKIEDVRLDKSDSQLYCYACWAKSGTEFCGQCGEFAAGHRESTRRHTTPFYCESCWTTYNAANKKGDADADGATAEKSKKAASAKPKPKKGAKTDAAATPTDSSSATAGEEQKADKKPREKKEKKAATPSASSSSAAAPTTVSVTTTTAETVSAAAPPSEAAAAATA